MNRDEMVAGVRHVFDLVAADYNHVGVPFFEPIAAGLVEAVGAAPGERALDLGCGNGVSTRALASAVAPGGSLVGLDVSPSMVDMARAAVDGQSSEVTFLVGDASQPKLPAASFDVVIASLVLFFLPDPAAALSRWVRLLRPGGRIGLSTFAAPSPHWQALSAHLHEFMPGNDPQTVGPQSPFSSNDGMERLLAEAGATGIRTSTRRVEFAFASFEQWVAFSRSVGQRAAWERMSAEDASEVLHQARHTFDAGAGRGGTLPVWQDVRYTVGARSPS